MIRVSEAYDRREILLVGANGFIGKVLLGLLLARFPQVRHIYFLMRPKTGEAPEDRFSRNVLGSPPLAPMVEQLGEENIRRKVLVVPGDVSLPYCGVPLEHLDELVGRVALIINCAGLVEFTPPVDDALSANVDGVEHVLEVAKHLGAKLVHVSTCFVCGVSDGLVEETEPIVGFYPWRNGPDDFSFDHRQELAHCREQIRRIYESAKGPQAGGAARSKEVARRLIELGKQRARHWGWVNTYTYSKSMGEQVLASQNEVEWAIVRPSIVEAALRFPFPGWVEGGRTAAPLVLMAMSGLRHWPVREDAPLEVIPVDQVAAATLAVGALLLKGRHQPVYQLAAADVNPLPLGELVQWLWAEYRRSGPAAGFQRVSRAIPLRRAKVIGARELGRRKDRLERRIGTMRGTIAWLRRLLRRSGLPDYRFLNAWSTALRILGLQLLFRNEMLELYQPFTLDNRFIFEAQNIRRAYREIVEAEHYLIPWDPERIDWREYWLRTEIPGIRKWVEAEAVRNYSFRM